MTENLKHQFDFYRLLIDKHKWDLEPMIQLLEYLDRTGICDKFYLSNSHDSLGISTGTGYEQRRLRPIVYITYLPDKQKFCIAFNRFQPRNLVEAYYKDPFDMAIVYRIEQWLNSPA